MSIDTLGLREQKKRETRQAISHQATQLFLMRGFDRTTIADIAGAARVAKMTVTNYFPRKEDLALDHHAAFVAGLAKAVADRSPGEAALGAVRRAYAEALERHDPVIGFTDLDFARMIAGSPTLVARLRDLHDQRENALTTHLVAEVAENPSPGPLAAADMGATGRMGGTGDAEVVARAVAGQLAAADRLLLRDLRARTLAGQSDDDIATALIETAQRVFDLLEPAIGTYAVRRTPAHTP
ncbi:TetR/AcrR family transcriptional regulator [Nonomuraea sp. NPDC002799]